MAFASLSTAAWRESHGSAHLLIELDGHSETVAVEMAVTLFLGGWHAPLPFLEVVPSYVWFFGKLAVLLFVFIWIRGTLPRMRVDHVMNFAWKFMMPMAFTCVIAAAAWHYARDFTRWLWSPGILLVVYFALSRFLRTNKNLATRTYRFAE